MVPPPIPPFLMSKRGGKKLPQNFWIQVDPHPSPFRKMSNIRVFLMSSLRDTVKVTVTNIREVWDTCPLWERPEVALTVQRGTVWKDSLSIQGTYWERVADRSKHNFYQNCSFNLNKRPKILVLTTSPPPPPQQRYQINLLFLHLCPEF